MRPFFALASTASAAGVVLPPIVVPDGPFSVVLGGPNLEIDVLANDNLLGEAVQNIGINLDVAGLEGTAQTAIGETNSLVVIYTPPSGGGPRTTTFRYTATGAGGTSQQPATVTISLIMATTQNFRLDMDGAQRLDMDGLPRLDMNEDIVIGSGVAIETDEALALIESIVIGVGTAIETDSGFSATPIVVGSGASPSFVAASTAAYVSSAGATTHTFSYAAATSGANRKLFVAVARQKDTGLSDISGITYNGLALTKAIDEFSDLSGTADIFIEAWYLDHTGLPTDGASYDVVISVSGETMNAIAAAIEYKDVKQGAPDVAVVTAGTTAGATATVNLSAVPANALIFGAAVESDSTTFEIVANQTERIDASGTGNAFSLLVADRFAGAGGAVSIQADPTAATGSVRFAAAAWGPATVTGATVDVGLAIETDAALSIVLAGEAAQPSFVQQRGSPYISTAAATSHTFAYTAAVGGSGRKLFVPIARNTASADITGVTYNGVALFKDFDDSHATGPAIIELWYLDHSSIPNDGGSYNVIVTLAAAADIQAGVIEYKDVKQGVSDATSYRQNSSGVAVLPGVNGVSGPPPDPPVWSRVWPGSLIIGAGCNGGTVTFSTVVGQNDRYETSGLTPTVFSFYATDKLNAAAVNYQETLTGLASSGSTRFVASAWRSNGPLAVPVGLAVETDSAIILGAALAAEDAALGTHAVGTVAVGG